ncbi:hypothetical protein HanXRQr2_Chr10g0460481 [Helianthus annuus]|uniref:Uncharacterized protein n=1 Tax=Helianthus annuus TaxID=4232 RepID=A0A9K3N615_HELAN|nr:hypothetical protein HanXRQr2_Chr10g0460481 [Helianthus annuus]KAJ0885376.1 hypothetical protein HanPSC8_Chr10g0444571 [Helianthus annuus]
MTTDSIRYKVYVKKEIIDKEKDKLGYIMRDDPFTRKIHLIYLTFYMPSKVEMATTSCIQSIARFTPTHLTL